jgi:restriction system protein
MEIDFHIPVINEGKQYWFVRTYGGEIFPTYYSEGYIGLGVNEVPQSLIKIAADNPSGVYELNKFIHNNTRYKNGAATKVGRELINFEHDIKIGDTIVIPSKNSTELAIGTVTSDVYFVNKPRAFKFRDRVEHLPQKRRHVKWERVIYRDDLNGDLKNLIGSHHGLTNANGYADVIEGTVDSLYIKNDHAYLTLKVNQDEDINAFVLSRFLNDLTYFYQEFCLETGQEIDEDLVIKIKLQSKGKLALKAFCVAGVVGIAGLVALSSDSEVKLEIGKVKVEGKSKGFLKSLTDFLDAKQERAERYERFQDSMKELKAMRYDDSLKKSEEEIRNNTHAEREQK